ncbi:MAG: ureidoglycolate lyase [Saccharofermentanales bacterium]|jgi:ureidoglycolate hydrolase
MRTIRAIHVSPEVMADFGRAIRVTPDVCPDAESEIQTYYGQLAIMESSDAVQIGICVAKRRPFVVSELEYHGQTAELLFAARGDFVVPVTGSVEVDGVKRPDLEGLTAVRVNQGEGIFFDKEVWHWTPYPLASTSDVLVVFKKETPALDFISFKFDEHVEMTVVD